MTIAERRKTYDSLADKFPIDVDVSASSATLNGVNVEWTYTPTADPNRIVMYMHGGGYVYGSVTSHRHLASEIGRAVGARALAVDYRLAPENPFPAAIDDTVCVFKALIEGGVDPRLIAFAGDSAGGGLAIATMIALRDAGIPQPSCAWLLSPFTDMEATGRSYAEKNLEDPAVAKSTIEFVAEAYLNGSDPRTPLASPIHADLRGIAPLLIFVGASEVLLDDSVELARVAGASHVRTRLEIWPNMVHIWPSYYRMLAAGRKAIEAGAEFIRSEMKLES